MDKKFISENRYKKITRTSKQKKNVKAVKKVKSLRIDKIKINKEKISSNHRDVKISNAKKKKSSLGIKLLKVVACLAILVLVGYLSKAFLSMENNPIVQVFSPKNNDTKLVANYDFKVGVNKLGNTELLKTSNILSNEVIKYTNLPLINIDEKYNIIYKVLKNITKLSDTEYLLELDSKYNIKPEDIVNTINSIKNIGKQNVYYENIQNVKEAKSQDGKVAISLYSKDSYYIYTLNFPIYSTNEFSNNNYFYLNGNNISNVSLKFTRNDSNSRNIVNSITIQNYDDSDKMIEDFKNNSLDLFLTSSYNAMQLLGKHEYSLKKYRNGETIFLFGNKNSNLFKQKEIRQAIAYGINRDEIIKNLESTYAELIDLPYIYSDVKYRYDKTGAENTLISNSWRKIGGVYTKKINNANNRLELNMLVNKDDSVKIKIAESIKQMLDIIGIKINILSLTANEIDNKVKNNDYDLLLTTVYVNDNPNIKYLENFLNVNEITDTLFKDIENNQEPITSTKIKNIQDVLSQEFACIGMLAKDTNVVYQKSISGIESIGYMKIFNNIENIGKTK